MTELEELRAQIRGVRELLSDSENLERSAELEDQLEILQDRLNSECIEHDVPIDEDEIEIPTYDIDYGEED